MIWSRLKRKRRTKAATELSASRVQGKPFNGTAFTSVQTRKFYKRGSATDRTLYTVSNQGTVNPVGDKVSNRYSALYAYEGDGQYSAVSISNMYYKSSSTVTKYSISKYANAGDLYEADGEETVTVGVTEYPGTLYELGTYYSDGLYTGFKKAEIETQDVTALTV